MFLIFPRFNDDASVYMSALSMFRYANRWFVFRMDLIGLVTIVLTGFFTVLAKGSVSPAMAGLALANVFQACTFIPLVMRLKADFRARFNSVERVAEYAYVSINGIDIPSCFFTYTNTYIILSQN